MALTAVVVVIFFSTACVRSEGETTPAGTADSTEGKFARQRERMVKDDIEKRGVKDKLVLEAMRKVRRHKFVPARNRALSYADCPLDIGEGQTISQPYIVAYMTELLRLKGGEKVLEIGTGSGYQAAVLAEIVKEVYTIEIIKSLAERAKRTLTDLGYKNITVKHGDGYRGWKEHAPFDAIIVTASPDHIPQPLLDQLRIGGRLVIPVGKYPFQELTVVTRTKRGTKKESVLPVLFVPMTGEAEREKQRE